MGVWRSYTREEVEALAKIGRAIVFRDGVAWLDASTSENARVLICTFDPNLGVYTRCYLSDITPLELRKVAQMAK